MARSRSLARSEDFRIVMRAGKRSRFDGVTTYVCPGSTSTSRLGIAVRAPNAVVRNRIKRRVRAAFREVAPRQVWDIVVRAEASSLQVDFQDLSDGLRRALQEGGGPCV